MFNIFDMTGTIRNLAHELLNGVVVDTQNIGNLVGLSPQGAFGDTFWETMLKISNKAVMPFCLVLVAFFVMQNAYTMWCRGDGAVTLPNVVVGFAKIVLPWLLITQSHAVMQLMFNLFANVTKAMTDGFTSSVSSNMTQYLDLMLATAPTEWVDQIFYSLTLYLGTLITKVMNIFIFVIVYIRLFEMTTLWFFSPIPLCTLMSDEWKEVGKGFLKKFLALLLQGAIMLLSVGFYTALLVGGSFLPTSANGFNLWSMFGISIVLIVVLLKSGTTAKNILSAF